MTAQPAPVTPPPIKPRHRVARGPDRPQYSLSAENDRMMMIVTALAAEMSVLRDRLDTHEALAEGGIAATPAAIDAFRPDEGRAAARAVERDRMLKRVFRILMEELDAVRQEKGR